MIREDLYSAGDIIFRAGDHKEDTSLSLYVVESGAVELYYQREEGAVEIIVAHLEEGANFGEFEFFTGKARYLNARATESCSVLSIPRARFVPIVY